ncbi:dipicolinate synthase subunit DpsA [Herbinix luporum]|uniref:dipicolinate synthase subunit DpsA n=1 Tax=Herbinix luporum TaxID=1679721 RepID=UPI0023F19BF4|nr:dipicolinate synthase subunit DpsA [Herbinix luporum]
MAKKIGIFGGDKRQVYMALSLLNKGYSVYTYRLLDKITHKNHTSASGLDELMKKCQVLIGPIPLTKDIVTISSSASNSSSSCNIADLLNKDHMLIGGVIPQDLEDLCENKGIFCYDLMRSDKIAIMNAIATAEGTILEAIKNSDRNIHNSNCLILGYGRCGKVLADKLKGLDAKVTIAARREASLAYAQAAGFNTVLLDDIKSVLPKFHFIFNTIPSLVLDQNCLKNVSPDVVIIDIASAPGGVDFEYALNHGINAKLCLGIPGKVSPRTSADILVAEIEALIKERSG